MRGRSLAHFTNGLLSLHLFAGCVGAADAQPRSDVVISSGVTAARYAPLIDARAGRTGRGAYGGPQEDGSFESLEQALRAPGKVKRLVLGGEGQEMKRLPPGLGSLVNLETLEISCLENLEALPEEIGKLRKLQQLIIDNGNGCSMNVSLPRSIGQLGSLRVLRLYGALDAPPGKIKSLPDTLADLQNLEELDLGRNGLRSLPPQIASLRGLKRLTLDFNDLREIPAFVGDLTNLEELSLRANGGVRLPQSLAGIKGLKVSMGNNKLKLRDQKLLMSRFPNAVFSFENEYDDAAANEEPAKPKPRRRR